MINQSTKFEKVFGCRYEAMNGGEKCRKWVGLGLLEVMGNVTIR